MDQHINNNYKHSEITKLIIQAAIEVHKNLGCGFQEVIYQRAMKIEMEKLGLEFGREMALDIIYNGQNIGSRRIDFLIEDKVLVEIKAIDALEEIHQVQLLNYLKIYKIAVGLLINFGAIKQVEIKRMVL